MLSLDAVRALEFTCSSLPLTDVEELEVELFWLLAEESDGFVPSTGDESAVFSFVLFSSLPASSAVVWELASFSANAMLGVKEKTKAKLNDTAISLFDSVVVDIVLLVYYFLSRLYRSSDPETFMRFAFYRGSKIKTKLFWRR